MGLYDIMDDISQRKVLKTETGDNRIFGVVVGVIENNYEEKHPGKVCVRIPGRDQDKNILKWAKVAFLAMGKTWGNYWLPEVGDEVLVAFEEGNIDKPYVIGSIPKSDSKLISEAADKDNKFKELKCRNGAYLKYEDEGTADSETDRVQLHLAKNKLFIDMDTKEEKIVVSDKDSKNSISIEAKEEAGRIRIICQKKLEINVGDKIKVIMNGDNGTVSIECDKYNVKASNSVNVTSDGKVKEEGQTVAIKAGGSLKVESSGPASVKGSVVKLG